jgi:hypothetical protein
MYFILTNENYYNADFKHKTGLNLFYRCNEFSQITSLRGLFYFATKEDIPYFYNNTYWIRPVIVPANAKIIKGWRFRHEKGWASREIILGDRFPLYDLKTIKKFNLNITSSYISEVCKRGKVDILEWWKNSGLELKYDESALYLTSGAGHINVLEWWQNSGLELKYDKDVLNMASRDGKVEVLEWWKKSGLKLKYDESVLNFASVNGSISVLEWFKNSGLKLKYTSTALNWASEFGKVEVLEWWKNSGLELKYTVNALNKASRNGHGEVLEWWKNSGLGKVSEWLKKI